MLRSVLDTNVVLASQRGQNPSGPNREIVHRWRAGEFTALYTEDLVMEYAEKLLEHDVPEAVIRLFLASIRVLGEKVSVQRFHLAVYPEDPDDIAFLLCAVNGRASHIVSYDQHLLDLRAAYEHEFRICQPIDFLADLRQSTAAQS